MDADSGSAPLAAAVLPHPPFIKKITIILLDEEHLAVEKFAKMLQLTEAEALHEALRSHVVDAIQEGFPDAFEAYLFNRVFTTRKQARSALDNYGALLTVGYSVEQVQSTLFNLSVEQDEDGWIIVRDSTNGLDDDVLVS